MAKQMTGFGPESVDQMGAEMVLDLDQGGAAEFFFLGMKEVNPMNVK